MLLGAGGGATLARPTRHEKTERNAWGTLQGPMSAGVRKVIGGW